MQYFKMTYCDMETMPAQLNTFLKCRYLK